MNSEGRIYQAPEDEISAEDKARLEGYLRGRAEEADLAERAERMMAAIEEREEGRNAE